jgi:RNA polymerase sigma factor (sigma-70 family)
MPIKVRALPLKLAIQMADIEMLFQHPEMNKSLSRIAARLAREPFSPEDLFQEALVHLWQKEQEQPNQSRSWYVQSCCYYLQNLLRMGRSVDCAKRNGERVTVGDDVVENAGDQEDIGDFANRIDAAGDVVAEVSARDFEAVLAGRLCALDGLLLERLAAGFTLREVGEQLGISHAAVVKHRRRIASLAAALGILPVKQLASPGKARALSRRVVSKRLAVT